MDNITTYTPSYRSKIGFFGVWISMLRNIIKSRELIYVLFKRDFFAIYRKSYLGIAWILISPLVGIVSWVFMNSTGILDPGDVGVPYPAYVLISSSIWGLFMGYYSSASSTLGAGSEFIMQVKYPHEALLVKQTMIHLANFAINLAINIIVLLIFGVTPTAYILLLPIITLPLFLLGASIGLIISVVSIVASDLTSAFNILFGFVFYITPVIYSTDKKDTTLQKVIELNPLTYLVGGVRDLILFGEIDHLDRFLFCSLVSLVLFLLSLRLFYVSEDKVVEKMI